MLKAFGPRRQEPGCRRWSRRLDSCRVRSADRCSSSRAATTPGGYSLRRQYGALVRRTGGYSAHPCRIEDDTKRSRSGGESLECTGAPWCARRCKGMRANLLRGIQGGCGTTRLSPRFSVARGGDKADLDAAGAPCISWRRRDARRQHCRQQFHGRALGDCGYRPDLGRPVRAESRVGRLLMEHVLARAAERRAPGVRLVQAAYNNQSLCLTRSLVSARASRFRL
jgi:hypothetical protein